MNDGGETAGVCVGGNGDASAEEAAAVCAAIGEAEARAARVRMAAAGVENAGAGLAAAGTAAACAAAVETPMVAAACAPDVSVIVPVCNVERFLDECLLSIRAQEGVRLEIICLNDGSTDDSLVCLQRHAAQDARIRVIDKPNEGYGATCNRGLAAARGRWVAVVEPDDYLLSGMYARMLALAAQLEARSGVPLDVVKTPWYELHDWNDPAMEWRESCRLRKRLRTSRAPFTLNEQPALAEPHPAIWSALYRRAWLEAAGIRFPEYPGAGWADNPFMAETLIRARGIAYLDEPFYCYRVELPRAPRPDAPAAAVALPFERWHTMLGILRENGANDAVLQAHYLRGFNYLHNAELAYGQEHPAVRACTQALFAAMDARLVRESAALSPARKQRFAQQTAASAADAACTAAGSSLPYYRRVAAEAFRTLRADGLAALRRRLRGR